jgi:hypothetical protein
MIKMTAKIFVSKSNDTEIESANSNIDKFDIASNIPVNRQVEASNPWILGVTPMQNVTVHTKLDYYLGEEFANQSGVFEKPYTITVTGNNISELTIIFDKQNNQYPPEFVIDKGTPNESIVVTDDASVALSFATGETHTITISKWNVPNYPLKITGILGNIANIIVNERNAIYLGREIADLLLAVNRPYGKSDYIPCICWGRNARFASRFEVGMRCAVWGRIQSREYVKKLSETATEKRTAYEVSVSKLECLES